MDPKLLSKMLRDLALAEVECCFKAVRLRTWTAEAEASDPLGEIECCVFGAQYGTGARKYIEFDGIFHRGTVYLSDLVQVEFAPMGRYGMAGVGVEEDGIED